MTRRLHSTTWPGASRLHLRWTDADRTLCGRRVPGFRRPWPMATCSQCRRASESLELSDVHVDWVWQHSTGRQVPASM